MCSLTHQAVEKQIRNKWATLRVPCLQLIFMEYMYGTLIKSGEWNIRISMAFFSIPRRAMSISSWVSIIPHVAHCDLPSSFPVSLSQLLRKYLDLLINLNLLPVALTHFPLRQLYPVYFVPLSLIE